MTAAVVPYGAASFEQHFLTAIPLHTPGDILRGGLSPGRDSCGQVPGIALSFQDGSDDVHPANAAQVAQHIAELHIHLRQDFLHALNSTARLSHQIAPLSPQGARNPDLVGGLKAIIQQTKSVQLQQPLTLLNVTLLRPGTFFVCWAFTRYTSRPCCSRTSNTGIQ